jgi:two-component system sensor histidine kinase RpfC
MSSLADRTHTREHHASLRRLGRAVIGLIERIPRQLRGDYVMAANRFMAGCLMFGAACFLGQDLPFIKWALPIAAWIGCGLLLLLQMYLMPHTTAFRRSTAIGLDVSGASIMLAAGGEATSFVYVAYLWIIIGNGFRFGPRYIFAAMAASVCGFAAVTLVTPFWREHPSLSAGLLSGIVVLPAYSFALIRQFAEAKRQAERADHAKSLFLASVSHELRTPLNAIIGTAELLAETALDDDQADMVATISSAADGQLSLVRDVLEFSRIEAGHGRTEEKLFYLTELLTVVRAIVAVEARRKGLHINSFITARTPLRLVGDERHLREILLNLCDNAIKFTAAGSVTIAADAVPAAAAALDTVPADRAKVHLRLEVSDTGIGIAPEAQGRIFELFTQADVAIVESFGGTGLGLALCDRQVRLMGGTIQVQSAPGEGSTFIVCVDLPVAPERALDLPNLEILALPPRESAASAIAALLAEDASIVAGSATTGALCRIAFVQAGSAVLPRGGADAAIEVLQGPARGLPGRMTRERFASAVSEESGTEDLRRALRIASAFALKRAPAMHALLPVSEPAQGATGGGLRVLVADDNAINRTIVSRMLTGAGMRPIPAHNGEEALELMSDGAVDVALLDVNMPVMDGIEAAEMFRIAVPGGGNLPLIALTADATPQTRERCLRAGMTECLVKPVRTADLLDSVGRAIAARASRETVTEAVAGAPTLLDMNTLSDLQSLGGADFVAMLVQEFKRDGGAVLQQLEAACVAGDLRSFRVRAHSLCSIAANVGGLALRELCLPWKDISGPRLDRDGPMLMVGLRQKWNRTQDELDLYVASLTSPSEVAREDRHR